MRLNRKARIIFRCAAATAALFVMTGLSTASAQDSLKIGVVNVALLIDQAPQKQLAEQALQDEFAPRQREIQTTQKNLQDVQERLQKDGEVMGAEERSNAQRQARDLQRDLQRLQNEYQEDFNIRRNEELKKLQDAVLREVQAYGQTANYDIVMGSGVVYASSAVDITPEILKRLQDAYNGPKGKKGKGGS